MTNNVFPTSAQLEGAVLQCLLQASSPSSNEDIESFVVKNLQISEELSKVIKSGNRTELQYRLAWTRTKLKSKGLIEKTGSKAWKAIRK